MVIVGVMRNDEVRTGLAYEVDHDSKLISVGGEYLHVRDAERRVLGSRDLGSLPRFFQTNASDLLRSVIRCSFVALCGMAHHDLVLLRAETGERTPAEIFEIVRMSADGKDAHYTTSLERAICISNNVGAIAISHSSQKIRCSTGRFH